MKTRKTLLYYFKAMRPYKVTGLVLLFSVIINSVIDVAIPLYFKDFFNILTSSETPAQEVVNSLFSILIIIAAFSFARWFFWRTANFSAIYFQARVLSDLANYCFSYLHKHSLSYFTDNFVGSLVKRVNWFVRAFERISDEFIFRIMPLFITLGLIIVVLMDLNAILGLGILLWAFIFLTISWLFAKYKFKYDLKRNEAESSTTGLLADTIANNSNVKLFNGYKREVSSFKESTKFLARKRILTWNLNAVFDGIQGLFAFFLEIGILFAVIKLWQAGVITVGDFVMVQFYIFAVVEHVWSFNRVIRNIYERLSDAEEMTTILETPHEIKDIPKAKELIVKEGRIEFVNVCFNYSKTRNVINKINLNIPPRERLAVIGPSGAGKSTLVKLLLRAYELTRGKIIIDGQNIAKVTQESLWKNIGIVSQEPILFHRSLRENILYGKPEASEEEVLAASKMAHCHEFIGELDSGYETLVGERGIKLSGGERQRVAIARAILKNAPILILDEATSSLDSESEMLIQEALQNLMKNKTVIVIAHRLSTIRKMDRIIVIDEGIIVEDGSHKELLNRKEGIYHRLWKLQAGGFIQ